MRINTAVIVEPRLHKYLENVINNAIKNLSIDTNIHIFHGIDNIDFLNIKYKEYIEIGKIKLTNLNKKNLTRHEYSKMLTTQSFWEQIDGENILIFQTDSCICCNIDDFDLSIYNENGFVGAPTHSGFNGGFSLRKKSLMIKAILDNPMGHSTWPEDYFYSVTKKHITKPASYENSLKFSVEMFYFDKPFGIHNAVRYLSANDWNKLKKSRPEISLVFDF